MSLATISQGISLDLPPWLRFLWIDVSDACFYCILSLCVCSAGVGRTGVFITLSIVLERMRYEGVVDMFQTVKMLRTQRAAMVQTEVGCVLF